MQYFCVIAHEYSIPIPRGSLGWCPKHVVADPTHEHAVTIPVARRLPGGLAVAFALAAVYLIWGSTYLGIRFALEGGYPPLLAVSGVRFVIAGTALYAVLRWRGVAAPTRAQWKTLAMMGAMMLLLGNGFVVLAEKPVVLRTRGDRGGVDAVVDGPVRRVARTALQPPGMARASASDSSA